MRACVRACLDPCPGTTCDLARAGLPCRGRVSSAGPLGTKRKEQIPSGASAFSTHHRSQPPALGSESPTRAGFMSNKVSFSQGS